MIKKIGKALIEGNLIGKTIKYILKNCTKLRKRMDKLISIPVKYIFSRTIKVKDNSILFLTTRGDYDCNSKWICNEIIERRLPYSIYWTCRKSSDINEFPKEIKLVKRGSYDFYRAASESKIIVDNSVNLSYLEYRKKKEQILLETWHGSLGIKKFSKDTVKDKIWIYRAMQSGKRTDYCISNSDFEDEIYREDYWKTTPILKLGHARNDILCEKDTERLAEIRKKIYKKYSLEENIKICLYAPTFRDDGDMRPYEIDYGTLKNALKTRFGGEWVIFTRFHFKLLKNLKRYEFEEGVVNVSDYPDIQELISCIEVGITDYSSWICDYMLRRKPGFLFATDMEEYQQEDRAFFYPLNTMPFPLALDNEQLIDNILNFDDKEFVRKCEEFLSDKGCIDDGHASERIVDAIEELMKGKQI